MSFKRVLQASSLQSDADAADMGLISAENLFE